MVLLNVVVVAAAVLIWGLCVFLMWKGWRQRVRHHESSIGQLHPVPERLAKPTVDETSGLYIGSALAGNWQARVAAHGLGMRAVAALTGYREGVLLERKGSDPLWIPRSAITEVRTDRRLAGKVMTKDGLLVIRWRPAPDGQDEKGQDENADNDVQVDTGFRGDDKSVYPRWISEFGARTSRKESE